LSDITEAVTRVHKLLNLTGVVFPFLAFVTAIVLLWNTWVDWSDLAVLAIMYVLTGYGVTLGFHRLLTHRSFQTFKSIEYTLAAVGSMAVQGPVMSWSPTIASTTRTPTRKATRTPRTATAAASGARSPGSGTRTWAGCSTAPARPRPSATPRISTRTARCE
jgi:hypothetical protein